MKRMRHVGWPLISAAVLSVALIGMSRAPTIAQEPAAGASREAATEPAEAAAVADPAVAGDETGGRAAASWSRREALIASLTIFVLAIFVGFEVITKVPPTLHTPLMSGSNAISGITLVGAVIVTGAGSVSVSLIGTIAVILATVNVVGGFLVTGRMLAMFKKRK